MCALGGSELIIASASSTMPLVSFRHGRIHLGKDREIERASVGEHRWRRCWLQSKFTSCIAAICENGEKIVTAADRMFTANHPLNVQFEPQLAKSSRLVRHALE